MLLALDYPIPAHTDSQEEVPQPGHASARDRCPTSGCSSERAAFYRPRRLSQEPPRGNVTGVGGWKWWGWGMEERC